MILLSSTSPKKENSTICPLLQEEKWRAGNEAGTQVLTTKVKVKLKLLSCV